jgi:hypothetical protein
MLSTVVLYSAPQDVLDAIHEEEEADWRREQEGAGERWRTPCGSERTTT